ncbi:hypothetical protein ANOM_011492 [Aspergillus nomiae NRRL 13137]|uniref:Uncharacterized protein n=1 Tax=Aspergillus nomiae NRRL (strain ATCC 15546 / NRRL 13137 / CBS 260.88 / M93) TaxID=1509407 RepID=A0A0L1IM24_ASPN3|nr:uncharacterized protein ANOM_011492 [Aspergillus nomiae NRRL 13137]KNG80325.1 hypothetical protein ANOM_011492 [Aspergillus nomiae NRRL 13137]
MAPDPWGDTIDNAILIDDDDEAPGTAGRETPPEMTALPVMMADGTVENHPYGLPLGVFLDDDQHTESTEVATPPPSLIEDMAEGIYTPIPRALSGTRSQKSLTWEFLLVQFINADTEGEHRSRQPAIGVYHGTDYVHLDHPNLPNEVQEPDSTPEPATSNNSGCSAPNSEALES